MARPLRNDFAGALHHITSRGNNRGDIFVDDQDRLQFLAFLAETVIRFGRHLYSWVLMTNHFHLEVETPEANLSRGMHWLNGRYAQWFNPRHGRCGHLFQRRFEAKLIEGESYLLEVAGYIVLNPVRAGMVDRPEAYRWSSYRATVGLEAVPPWLRRLRWGQVSFRFTDFLGAAVYAGDPAPDPLLEAGGAEEPVARCCMTSGFERSTVVWQREGVRNRELAGTTFLRGQVGSGLLHDRGGCIRARPWDGPPHPAFAHLLPPLARVEKAAGKTVGP